MNYIDTRMNAVVVVRFPSTLHGDAGTMLTAFQSQGHAQSTRNASAENVQCVEPEEDRTFSGHYLRNRSTLDIGVLGYIGIL